jgi:translation initiation factor 2B subunit (eIF-2B alpha/beta/delta family)
MCEVTLKINENQIHKINPNLKDLGAITRWVQRLVDVRIADLVEIRSRENLKPYTMEEINARIDQAEEELANGGGMDFDEAMDMIEKELDEELEMAEAV